MNKYFESKEEGGLKWKEQGKRSLKERIKQTYDLIYTSCRAMGVTHPSFLAMGLGNFLSKIPKEFHDAIKAIYHEAQFELLCDPDKDYKFTVVFLNPAVAGGVVARILENASYAFRCPVVVHFRDSKKLAMELAERGKKTSTLCPSDPIGMMQGYLGNSWEGGYSKWYLAEQDTVAISTAILGRVGISNAFSDESRMVYHPEDERSMLGSNGTMLGVAPSEVEEEDAWVEQKGVGGVLNGLAESLLLHQPKDIEQHILRWSVDRLLQKWEDQKRRDREKRTGKKNGCVEEQVDKTSIATVMPDLRQDFKILLLDLAERFQAELNLDEKEKKLIHAQSRIKSGGMSDEDAKRILTDYCKAHQISLDNYTQHVDLPVIWAIEQGQVDLAEHLVQNAVQLDLLGTGGNTALHVAAEMGSREVVEALLKKHTELHQARHDNVNLKINHLNDNGDTALHLAVTGRFESIVKALIAHPGINLSAPDAQDCTPLHAALIKNSISIAQQFVDVSSKLDLNRQDNLGLTPLMYAIGIRNDDIALKLLRAGARHDLQDKEGLDALHYALQQRMPVIVDNIVKRITDPNRWERVDQQQNSYLHWAFREGAPSTAEVLIGKRVPLDKPNDLGLKPLHLISKYDTLCLLPFLKAHGYDQELPEEHLQNHTPLHLKAASGNLAEVKRHVEAGVYRITTIQKNPDGEPRLIDEEVDKDTYLNRQTGSGLKAIHLALHFNHPDVAFYLLDVGAKLPTAELNVHAAHMLKHDLQALFVTKDKIAERRSNAKLKVQRMREQIQELQKRSAQSDARSQDRVMREELYASDKEDSKKKETRMDDGINDKTVSKNESMRPFELENHYVPDIGLEDFLRQPHIRRQIGLRLMDTLLGEAKLFVHIKMRQIQRLNTKDKDDSFMKKYGKMSRDHIMALYVYSYECDIYKVVNNAVRKCDTKVIEEWKPFLYYLINALRVLPKEKETMKVFRGISVNVDRALYKVGQEVRWASFSSSSGDQSVAQQFLGDSAAGGTIFIISTQSAASIQQFSAYPEEDEVLFPPNTEFTVQNVLSKKTADLLHLSSLIIELKETKASIERNNAQKMPAF
eukprot:TRINITY_DN67577_c8_g1_i11.p1 TRINITY_DN67577_c8_g1~~TRINITY_DN67577_c8_g1_i11.p1  ORF type:complete len:1276 (+),score=127.69 TRINITY_DN67577_c8_g1_i11:575-3829(+)